MNNSICGFDCTKCDLYTTCKGCIKTNGKPFGKDCILAICSKNKKYKACSECNNGICALKEELIKEFNDLNIKGMKKVKELLVLSGSFVNMEYQLQNGEKIKLFDDNKMYLGNQLCKSDERCYGLAADNDYLLVCEYGENGINPEIIIYKKRERKGV